jgi:hypothetical protein
MALFSKAVGEVPVPGEATITLPAGNLKINYEEARKGREADDGSGKSAWLGVPEGLSATITPASGGEALTIESPKGYTDYSTLRRIGSRFAKVAVPADGEYVVTIAPVPATGRELFDPKLKFKT